MASWEFVVPATPEEAIRAVQSTPGGEAVALAGGTDLLFDLGEGRVAPRSVVSLRKLPWRTLEWRDGALSIGSTLPLRKLETDPELAVRLPALAEAVRAVGGVALRHRATLGGNLGRAAPSSDLLPALLALEAEVELIGASGSRTVPIDQFLRASRQTALHPGELIRSVRIPETRSSAYLWQRVRPANDISQVAVAVAYSRGHQRWRVALGGVPPRAVLVPEAEQALGGSRPSSEAIRVSAERLSAHPALVSDRRATEEYRRHLVGVLLLRAIDRAVREGHEVHP
jgi:xanthine dehydrogenase small subunit